MKLFKIIDARIRTTKQTHLVLTGKKFKKTHVTHNVCDGNPFKQKTDVTYRPQVKIQFLWFTWWQNVCWIECQSHAYAIHKLRNCIKEYNKNVDMIETEYEYIEI